MAWSIKKKFIVHVRGGFPDSSVSKESIYNAGDPSLIPGPGRSPGEGTEFWPGESHGLYSPWGHKELDTTEAYNMVCGAVRGFSMWLT